MTFSVNGTIAMNILSELITFYLLLNFVKLVKYYYFIIISGIKVCHLQVLNFSQESFCVTLFRRHL